MTFDGEMIKRYEATHYRMQLGGYFTELTELSGVQAAYTTAFTDVWYNQAYAVNQAATPATAIAAVEQYFTERDRHPCIYTSPTTGANFLSALTEHNYVVFEKESWMLADVTEARPRPDDALQIKAVTNDYEDFATVYRAGLPGPEVEDYIQAAIAIQQHPPADVSVTYLLAYKNDTPVGMLGLHMADGIGGVYAVATVPGARNQGVATALHAEATRIAGENNCTHLLLQTVTGEDSEKVFEKLGYKTMFTRQGFVQKNVIDLLTHG